MSVSTDSRLTGISNVSLATDASGNVVGISDNKTGLTLPLATPSSSARFQYTETVLTSRTNRGTYGHKIASWTNALQNQAGTATLVTTTDLPPFSDNATKVLRLDQNATASFGQQNPIDGGQPYLPQITSPGFTLGFWVKNPNTRTLNFEVRVYNVGAAHTLAADCAIEPTNTWTFLTVSAPQLTGAGWVQGTDLIAYVRFTQQDNKAEGAWNAGEYLLFSNV